MKKVAIIALALCAMLAFSCKNANKTQEAAAETCVCCNSDSCKNCCKADSCSACKAAADTTVKAE